MTGASYLWRKERKMAKIKNSERNYLIRWNGKRYLTRSLVRFLRFIRSLNWQELKKKCYLKVSYGKGFYNDGEYDNKADFDLALNAFLED